MDSFAAVLLDLQYVPSSEYAGFSWTLSES